MVRTRVGYAGGHKPNPTYENLGDHSESVQIDFDPKQITYQRLLDVFWKTHSPCVRSGSRQYQPIIFYHNDSQRSEALASRQREAMKYRDKIQTELLACTGFTLAEDFHQKYQLRQNSALFRELHAIYPDTKGLIASTAAARINGYLGGNGTREGLEREIDRLGLSPAGKERLRGAIRR